MNKYIHTFVALNVCAVVMFVTESARLCGPNHFRCRDGKRCVAAVDVCDQESHCSDSSDENHYLCSGNFSSLTKSVKNECNPGMYRCRFGGCIDASKLCNGQADCFDSSDETSDLCRKNRCQGKRFRCDYGGCVRNFRMCDGRTDCLDSSDETRKMCAKKSCPEDSFKCKYGACIPKSKMCDGKRHCFDKSDEEKEMCDREQNGSENETATIINTLEE